MVGLKSYRLQFLISDVLQLFVDRCLGSFLFVGILNSRSLDYVHIQINKMFSFVNFSERKPSNMFDIFGSVKGLLNLDLICIDNNIFRLHYKVGTCQKKS